MSKKDYEIIAKALKELHERGPFSTAEIATVATKLVEVFSADNPRFDSTKFLKACGLIWSNED